MIAITALIIITTTILYNKIMTIINDNAYDYNQ